MATLAVHVSWSYTQDPNKPEDGFIIKRAGQQNAIPTNFVEIAHVGPGIGSYIDPTVVAGTTYYYAVYSFSGSSVSVAAQTTAILAMNPVPNAPSGATAVVVMV